MEVTYKTNVSKKLEMTLKTIASLDIIDTYRKLYPITATPDYA